MARRFDRLTRQKDFAELKRRGTTGNARFVTVRGGATVPRPKLAIIVSHRVSKKAVHRNRVRRRIRAILHLLPAKTLASRIILIIARPGSDTVAYQTLREDVLNALTRAKLIHQ